MARNPASPRINESQLTKMELRKLGALRKSVGDAIAAKAFSEWYANRPEPGAVAGADRNAVRIAEAIAPDVLAGRIKIPRGGLLIRRGRGRVIVELPPE